MIKTLKKYSGKSGQHALTDREVHTERKTIKKSQIEILRRRETWYEGE